MNLYLLRHGETQWNQEERLQGHTDIPLNENGRMQMKRVAETMAQLCQDMDLIISSPLQRACESAEIVADKFAYPKENIVVEPLLIERCFGEGEGKTAVERAEKYLGDNYPQMEPFEDLLQRAQKLFDKTVNLYADKQNVLLVGHGAILYAMLTAITDGQLEYGGKKVSFDQGSIHLISYLDEKIELAQYNESNGEFLPIQF